MPPDVAALSFLHLLVFVYWLGGDLGAFYASTIIVDAKRSNAARATAAEILTNVDMAPRTALILAAPTGLSLAASRGLVQLDPMGLAAIWVAAIAWLALAWRLHLAHTPPQARLRRLDLAIRWLVIAGLIGGAIAAADLAAHVRGKLVLLAAAIALGLVIRVLLAPFGPAFAGIMRDGSTPEHEAALSKSLGRARIAVTTLWLVIGAAAFLGVSGGAGWIG
ncbi:MAG: hypothetical protein ACOYM8_14730 [Caulobacterales bacterium]